MIQAIPSQGFDADLKAVNQDGIVVLHRFKDGMLLIMNFDDEMPAFTTKAVEPGAALEEVQDNTTATGYVFWNAEPDVKGTFEFEGQRYACADIEDYVLWTDEEAVRRKYVEVCDKARGTE